MKILITAAELCDRNLWDEATGLLGINPWALNEGQMSRDDEVTLTEEQAVALRLVVERKES